jgi:hypothetical protein
MVQKLFKDDDPHHPLLPLQTPKFALQMWDEIQSPRHENSGTQQLIRVPSGSPKRLDVALTKMQKQNLLDPFAVASSFSNADEITDD